MGLGMNSIDFDSGHLFDSITPQARNEVSAEQLREQIRSRQNPDEMYEYIRTIPILFDQFHEALQFANNLLERTKRTKRPGGVWFIGDGGAGKSFLLEQILKRNQPEETTFSRTCPILYLTFSSRPTESDIMLTLLYQLGQDLNLIRNRNNAELEKILISALAAAKTIAILCDEAHHLWLNTLAPRVADRIGGRCGDLLKNIYDKSGVAFIFAGTPGLHNILEIDSQASTRWKGVFDLKIFHNGPEFQDILAAIDEAIPMHEPSRLDEYSDQIHLITKGNFRDLKDFIAEAVYLAAKKKASNISGYLYQACKNTFGDQHNPFDQAA